MTYKPIHVGYNELQGAVLTMKNISQLIDAKLDSLRRQLATVKWDGDSKIAWDRHQADWNNALIEMNRMLEEMARRVQVAGDRYMTTENEVSRIWRNAGVR
jgi:6 kDa early secretory antigenic target